MGWMVRGLNPDGGENFRTRLEGPWGPRSLLYNGYRFFPVGKAVGAWCWPPTLAYRRGLKKTLRLVPLWSFVACSRVNITFTFTNSLHSIILQYLEARVTKNPVNTAPGVLEQWMSLRFHMVKLQVRDRMFFWFVLVHLMLKYAHLNWVCIRVCNWI
jgi:hypothetical protein